MASRIEVSGILASGKSTLCDEFTKRGFPVMREDVSTNPYWFKAQEDPNRYGFLLSQHIIVDRERGVCEAATGKSARPYLIDYCMSSDKAYADFYFASISEEKVRALHDAIDDVYRRYGEPALVIHLRCETGELLHRVKQRGRDFEQSHTPEFLDALGEKIEHYLTELKDRGVPVMEIDTTKRAPKADPHFIRNVMRYASL